MATPTIYKTPNARWIASHYVGIEARWNRARFCRLAQMMQFTKEELCAMIGRSRIGQSVKFTKQEAILLQLLENFLHISYTRTPPEYPTAIDKYVVIPSKPKSHD